VADRERQITVACVQGYQSSVAAAMLRRFGFATGTDIIGG
jgi:hypothetical protein